MRDEVRSLMNKARRSLEAARSLTQEKYYDFAPSRAHYAMFYVAESLLSHLGQAYSKHAAVIAVFGREYAKTGRLDPKFHQWLIAAQNLRNTGDYGIDATVSEEDVKTVCQWADEFISVAEQLLAVDSGDPPKPLSE